MYRLLLIDEDAAFCEVISDFFGVERFETISLHNGGEALEHLMAPGGADEYDLILLDKTLPDVDGVDFLRTLRTIRNTPVIMLTSSTRVIDCIVGLETGADDFLVKPFDSRELLARVRAVLRRVAKLRPDALKKGGRIVLGDVDLDAGSRLVRRNGETLSLTSAEFGFLEMLLQAAGQVVSRELLAQNVLGRGLGSFDRSVDMHVSRLRKKLGYEHNGIERIKTVRGEGFVYTLPCEAQGNCMKFGLTKDATNCCFNTKEAKN